MITSRSRSQLLQVLKLVKGNFQTYLQSISFRGCQVYSSAVKDLLQLTGTVTLLADLIGFNTREVIEDIRRLSKFASNLNKKLGLLNGESYSSPKKRQPQKLRQIRAAKNSATEMGDLIKILACKKFGLPDGATVESVSSSRTSGKMVRKPVVIFPRQTRLTLDRAAFSRSKFDAEATSRTAITDVMSDVSVASESNNSAIMTKEVASPMSKQNLHDPISYPLKTQHKRPDSATECEEPEFLDLSEDELESIMRTKADFVGQEKFRSIRLLNDSKINDVLGNISRDIVNSLVQKVCQEVFDFNFIDSFIQLELKPTEK